MVKKIRKPEEEVAFEEPNKHLDAFVKEQVSEYCKVNNITKEDLPKEVKEEWIEAVLNTAEDTITLLVESLVDAFEPLDDDDDEEELGDDEENEDG